MKARVMRAFITPAIAVTAILAGGSAALATVPSAAPARPAGNISATSTVRDMSALTPLTPGPYTYYSNYPTLTACRGAGDWLKQHKNVYDFECVEKEGYGGAYTVFNLYFRII